MARIGINSLEEFYNALITLGYKNTLSGKLDIRVKCLGPELPYIKDINSRFIESDGICIRFNTKMVLAEKPLPDAQTVKVKTFDRYYFNLYKDDNPNVPFSTIKFNFINPWEYKEDNNNGFIDRYITTETVSDKVPVRIDIREYSSRK
jgi:hypothetical protein